MDHMEFDDPMEKMLSDEAKVAIDGHQSSLLKGPRLVFKVMGLWMIVVQIGDCHCSHVNQPTFLVPSAADGALPIQLFTQRYGSP